MKKAKNINVLIIDDHNLFRKGMVMLLDSFGEIAFADDAENGRKGLKKLKERNFDVVLLDLEMPVMDGWETAKRIAVRFPKIRIIMISMHDSLQIIQDMIEIGAHGFLLKNAQTKEVHRAIISAIKNDFYYNRRVAKALEMSAEEASIAKNVAKKADLSPREIQVLRLICKEHSAKEIGKRLNLSEQTVRTHRKNLMRKIGVSNAVGLVRFAVQNGIVRF